VKPAIRLLTGGRALAQWILDGGRRERRGTGVSLRLRWHAYWFEHHWNVEAKQLAQASLPSDPILIVGVWRSGTTSLHELLTTCLPSATPRTWQCFNPSTCFLTGAPSEESAAARPMDLGRIETRGPQEDEFALLLLGEPSVYRGFIDPRRLIACGEDLWSGRQGDLKRWQDFLRGIAATAPSSRLLLKSPNHSFRLPLVRRIFPRAQFIWIGRHTGEVLASNLRMWRAMMGLYGLWDCPAGVLERFLKDMLRAYANVLARCLDEVPPEQMLWVEFEQLRANPRDVLERVLEFVCADSGGVDSRRDHIEQAVARIPVHEGVRASLPDDPVVAEIETLMTAARRRWGFGHNLRQQSWLGSACN